MAAAKYGDGPALLNLAGWSQTSRDTLRAACGTPRTDPADEATRLRLLRLLDHVEHKAAPSDGGDGPPPTCGDGGDGGDGGQNLTHTHEGADQTPGPGPDDQAVSSDPAARLNQCPATGCTTAIPATWLLCSPHWRMVPDSLRNAVWTTWHRGKGAGSPQHASASKRAIGAVNRQLHAAGPPEVTR
jgi:hypothetical protein